MSSLEREDIASLVKRYAEAAAMHGQSTEAGDHKATNAAYKTLDGTYRELRRRGPEAQRALLPLLNNPDLGVQLWAGTHALEFAPEHGERTLSRISEIANSLVSFSAKMTLRQWREGKLRFP